MQEEPRKVKVYRCPKNCSVGDTPDRCRRCGEWKLYHGEFTEQEMQKFNEELTRAAY